MLPAKQPRDSLAKLAADALGSSQILPVLSSFPSLFRLQKWTNLGAQAHAVGGSLAALASHALILSVLLAASGCFG